VKKNLTVILLLFAFSLVKAQNELGVYAFPQTTTLMNKANRQGDPIYQPELTYTYGGGVTFNHDFKKQPYGMLRGGNSARSMKKKLGLKFGVFYSAHDQKFSSRYRIKADSLAFHEGRKRFDYLKFPVNLRLTIPTTNEHFNFALYGGPQISYLMRAQGGIVYWEDRGDHDYYDLPFSDVGYFKRLTLDAVAGADVEYKFKRGSIGKFEFHRWVHLVMGVRGDWSVSTVENKDAIINNYPTYGNIDNYVEERTGSRNGTLSLLFGFTYLFHVADYHRTRY